MKFGVYISSPMTTRVMREETDPVRLREIVEILCDMQRNGDDRAKEESINAAKILIRNSALPKEGLIRLVGNSIDIAEEASRRIPDSALAATIWHFFGHLIVDENGLIQRKTMLRHLLRTTEPSRTLPPEMLESVLMRLSTNSGNGRFILLVAAAGKTYENIQDKIREIPWFIGRRRMKSEKLFHEQT